MKEPMWPGTDIPETTMENKVENREQPVEHMTVFRVRHGDTEYKEQLEREKEDDLTDLGKEQIDATADTIIRRIDPDNDIVWVIKSPRVRAQNTGERIENKLKEAGIEIWDGARSTRAMGAHSDTFERIRNFDFKTQDGETLSIDDERYPAVFEKVVDELESANQETVAAQDALLNQHPQVENHADLERRNRNQITYLMRIARQIQPKVDKHIVIIQAEHTESMDDFIEQATDGKYTEKNVDGVSKGEVVEIHFPTDSNDDELEVIFPDRNDERFTIDYDPDKRNFS